MSDQEVVYDDLEDNSKSKIEKLNKNLKKCLSEKQEFLDGWQRSKADYINLKKRFSEEKQDLIDYAVEDFALDVISVIDSFEMALKDQEAWNKAPENWRTGVEFIYNQLTSILKKHGIEVINPLGEDFNHNLHHSLKMVEVNKKEKDGVIVDVIQKGYKLKNKVIRFATVNVGLFNKK